MDLLLLPDDILGRLATCAPYEFLCTSKCLHSIAIECMYDGWVVIHGGPHRKTAVGVGGVKFTRRDNLLSYSMETHRKTISWDYDRVIESWVVHIETPCVSGMCSEYYRILPPDFTPENCREDPVKYHRLLAAAVRITGMV
jgi:hypothetical protein